ncbi:MAG: helix-turn-helix domain-containing protein, partial [Oscillospiraceae bacterium]|nr:helix-turn-helix domain-containing protein [Oscillospiraceae bacterium]
LLYFLFLYKGQTFTKEQLYKKVEGHDDIPDASNMTSFIRKLRLKADPVPADPKHMITVRGVAAKIHARHICR